MFVYCENVDNLFANYIVQWCIFLDTQRVCILRNVDNLFAYYIAQVCIIRTRGMYVITELLMASDQKPSIAMSFT